MVKPTRAAKATSDFGEETHGSRTEFELTWMRDDAKFGKLILYCFMRFPAQIRALPSAEF